MFGSHLNKRKTSEKAGGSGIEGKECATKTGPTWKLRKWTKGGGYTTVSGGGDGGGGGGSQHHSHGEENGEGVCNASESGSSAASKKIQVKFYCKRTDTLHICHDIYTCKFLYTLCICVFHCSLPTLVWS